MILLGAPPAGGVAEAGRPMNVNPRVPRPPPARWRGSQIPLGCGDDRQKSVQWLPAGQPFFASFAI
jgi:hypothetical protein